MKTETLFDRMNDEREPLHERVGLLYVLARALAEGVAIPHQHKITEESQEFFRESGDDELCSSVVVALENDDRSGLEGLGYPIRR